MVGKKFPNLQGNRLSKNILHVLLHVHYHNFLGPVGPAHLQCRSAESYEEHIYTVPLTEVFCPVAIIISLASKDFIACGSGNSLHGAAGKMEPHLRTLCSKADCCIQEITVNIKFKPVHSSSANSNPENFKTHKCVQSRDARSTINLIQCTVLNVHEGFHQFTNIKSRFYSLFHAVYMCCTHINTRPAGHTVFLPAFSSCRASRILNGNFNVRKTGKTLGKL